MDSVFLVWYDNGEPYEDNYRCVEKIFRSYKRAEKYLVEENDCRKDVSLGYTVWKPKKDVCPYGITDACKCKPETCPLFLPDKDEPEECQHCDILLGNEYRTHFYTIEKMEVM